MSYAEVLDIENPEMSLVWKTALDSEVKKGKIKASREVSIVKVENICDDLKEVIDDQKQMLDSRTFYKTSMVMSGTLRVHSMQTDLLLEDTKKLLKSMRKESRDMKKFDEVLDCRPVHPKKLEHASVDTSTFPHTSRRPRNAQAFELDWHTLDCDIDWTSGPPRARMRDITMPDEDVPMSDQYKAELEYLRSLEGSLEGPTFLDLEMDSFHEPEEGEQPEAAPVDTLVTAVPEMEQQQLTTPTVLIHEPPEEQPAPVEEQPAPVEEQPALVEEQPALVEEPALPPAIQPEDLGRSEESEQPSQIELGSVEEQERRIPHTRVRHARPLMDAVCVLSKDSMKNQMKDYSDIMRTLTATEDVVFPGKVQPDRKDFFRTTPLHRGVIADVLLKYFRPCEGEATFAEPTLSLLGATEEFVREASRSEVKDLSSVLSVHQDTVESSRSRTLLEASSGLFEEQPSQLQPIEELQSPLLVSELQSPVPPPSPREGPAPATEPRPSPTKKSKRPSATKEPKKPSARKEPERGQEMSPTEQLEQQAVISEERSEASSKDSTIMKEGLTKIILEALEHNPTMFLHDLLQEDAGEREATEMFSHLLTMYQKFLVDLHQETTYGPISVSLHSPDEEDQE